MALNGSGIRDTARVLKISTTTVINELKKESSLSSVNLTDSPQLAVGLPYKLKIDTM